ncbi:unnamed protein product [Diabrotica balteata]|uniref:Endonuclease-reverse transcriptase n=1 Tax=Diabrotica balteata TaxID=107213 RepID=A0A9N9XIN7_DIABA|nr:unnamed protein product [Diabrotica balteata]
MCLKRRVYDKCILPVTTYGLENMAFTKKTLEQLSTTQRAKEGHARVSLRDRIQNTDISERTKIIDVTEHTARLKWQWVGHVARDNPEKWTQINKLETRRKQTRSNRTTEEVAR